MPINYEVITSRNECIWRIKNHCDTFYWILLLLITIRYIIIYLSTHISLDISIVKGNFVLSLLVNYLSDLRDSSINSILLRLFYQHEYIR